jgi:hypothetical protein
LFDHAQGKGLHILPVHYYSPVPDTSRLPPAGTSSFRVDVAQSRAAVLRTLETYGSELAKLFSQPDKGPHDYDPANGGYGPLDAAVLYGVVRERRPGRIIEIGSGASTLVIAAAIRAARRDHPQYAPRFTCIEPFVPPYLQPAPVEVSEVLAHPVQSLSLDLFRELAPGDLLFIDSTHVVNYGSDVVFEFLEILPILPVGVMVHVHDIFLPLDYPERWQKEHRFFWNEQYLLQAFLTLNPHYRVDIAVHAVSHETDIARSPVLTAAPSSLFGVAFWMSRVS